MPIGLEVVRRVSRSKGGVGRGLPVPVKQLVPKAECESSPLTLKKGREGVRGQIKLGVFEGASL